MEMQNSGRKIDFRGRNATTFKRKVSMDAGESLDLETNSERALI